MNKLLFAMGVALFAGIASAQTFEPTAKLDLQARFDYQYEDLDGTAIHDNSGFKGKYFNLKLNGQIAPKLTYSWAHRLNKSTSDGSFFDATDYLYLNYEADEHWSFSGGKQVVAIGGFEYDRAPINIYRASEFWNNIPCYQLGVSTTYALSGKDKIIGQLCTNPFRAYSNNNTYAYNLMWMGSHGSFQTIYSANLIEYQPGRYISYLALGNCFHFGKAALELDLMNRASSGQTYFFKDASVMANLTVEVSPKLSFFAKGTYDVNRTDVSSDYCVMPGTEMKMAGGGLEYHPLKNQRNELRLHAFCFYSWGKNSNPDATMKDKMTIASVGATWYMNVLNLKK